MNVTAPIYKAEDRAIDPFFDCIKGNQWHQYLGQIKHEMSCDGISKKSLEIFL